MPSVSVRDRLFVSLALQRKLLRREEWEANIGWKLAEDESAVDAIVKQGLLSTDDVQCVDRLIDRHVAREQKDLERVLSVIGEDLMDQQFQPASTLEMTTMVPVDEADGDSTVDANGETAQYDGAHNIEPRPHDLAAHEGDATTADPTGPTERPSSQLFALDKRFEVVRQHAKGGLGEVLVARDRELNRQVALKRILPAYANDPRARLRFVSEAEITGGLEHPGVVPVYSLGADQSGQPHYAMRFIQGRELKKAIKEFHAADDTPRDPGTRTLAMSKLLRRFVDVCNTMEYAHAHFCTRHAHGAVDSLRDGSVDAGRN